MSRVARTLLNCPECPDAGELSSNTDDEKVCKRQRVKNYDRILERCDNGHGRIQRVAEKEVAFGDNKLAVENVHVFSGFAKNSPTRYSKLCFNRQICLHAL
jgi:hypothetical protein